MLTTVTGVKALLVGVGETIPVEHEELLTHLIKRQSASVEEFCRRRLVKATYTDERHTGQAGQTEFYPHQWPINVVSVASIDGTAVAAGSADDQYLLLRTTDGETWALYLKTGWKSDPHKLMITYTAGYVLSAPTGNDVLIRDDLEGAVRELVTIAYLQRGKGGMARESFEGLSVDYDRWPSHIVQALAKYKRPRI